MIDLLDSAYLGISRNQVFRHGVRVEGRFKYNEIISIFAVDPAVFESILREYPQKFYKIKGGYKLTYVSKKASEILKKFAPLLKRNKKRAEIILKLSKDKVSCRMHEPHGKMERREALKRELDSLEDQVQ